MFPKGPSVQGRSLLVTENMHLNGIVGWAIWSFVPSHPSYKLCHGFSTRWWAVPTRGPRTMWPIDHKLKFPKLGEQINFAFVYASNLRHNGCFTFLYFPYLRVAVTPLIWKLKEDLHPHTLLLSLSFPLGELISAAAWRQPFIKCPISTPPLTRGYAATSFLVLLFVNLGAVLIKKPWSTIHSHVFLLVCCCGLLF